MATNRISNMSIEDQKILARATEVSNQMSKSDNRALEQFVVCISSKRRVGDPFITPGCEKETVELLKQDPIFTMTSLGVTIQSINERD